MFTVKENLSATAITVPVYYQSTAYLRGGPEKKTHKIKSLELKVLSINILTNKFTHPLEDGVVEEAH